MALPSYGAPPLAKTFLILRILQLMCFAIVIGITANFVQEIVSTGAEAPKEIIGTLTTTSVAALYSLFSIPFFWADAHLGLFIMCGLDFLLLIAFIIVAIVLGKPLSYLNCFAVGDASQAADAASALAFTESVANNVNKYGGYVSWIGATRTNCFESKAVWGVSIALCILFTCSVFLLPALFAKQKRAKVSAARGDAKA